MRTAIEAIGKRITRDSLMPTYVSVDDDTYVKAVALRYLGMERGVVARTMVEYADDVVMQGGIRRGDMLIVYVYSRSNQYSPKSVVVRVTNLWGKFEYTEVNYMVHIGRIYQTALGQWLRSPVEEADPACIVEARNDTNVVIKPWHRVLVRCYKEYGVIPSAVFMEGERSNLVMLDDGLTPMTPEAHDMCGSYYQPTDKPIHIIARIIRVNGKYIPTGGLTLNVAVINHGRLEIMQTTELDDNGLEAIANKDGSNITKAWLQRYRAYLYNEEEAENG